MKHALIGMAALALAGCTTRTESKPPEKATLGSGVEPGAEMRDETHGKETTPSLSETVEYWDGETRRKLWASDDTVVEFDPSDAGRDAVHAQDASAKEVEQPQKGVRLWKLSKGLHPDAVAQAASATSKRISLVLHEGPSPRLPMRALPGGVLATFPPGWDRTKIDAWLTARELHVEGSAVVADANMFLVATPPGLQSLKVADQLHDAGELVDVTPNFWMQNATK